MKKDLRNIAASVRQRLLNRSNETHRPFAELLQYYGMERFLYRLSKTEYKDKVILKGALMFFVWNTPQSRATKDIDLLGRLQNSIDHVVGMVKDACQITVDDDGIVFDPASVEGGRIKEDADFEGVRARFTGRLGQARINMQIDIGFGDTIFPSPETVDYPSLLDMPRPQLKGYPRETVVAEKFEAMVNLEMLNSRMKDFYDIWLLANQFDFEGDKLGKSLSETFVKRKRTLTVSPVALSVDFVQNPQKKAQWAAFIRKGRLDHAPKELEQVIPVLRKFLLPIVESLAIGQSPHLIWKAPGPWQKI